MPPLNAMSSGIRLPGETARRRIAQLRHRRGREFLAGAAQVGCGRAIAACMTGCVG